MWLRYRWHCGRPVVVRDWRYRLLWWWRAVRRWVLNNIQGSKV